MQPNPIKAIARFYNIDLIDRGQGEQKAIISLGAGMLMSTMDLLPNHRYAFEYNKSITPDAFGLLNYYLKNITVTAWFSISHPRYLIECLKHIESSKINYYSNIELIGVRFNTLKDLKDNEGISNFKENMV